MTQPIGLDALIQFVREQHPGGDALMHLRDAMLVSQQLSDQADTLIGHFVDQARRAGASWSAIGEAMGVTKQAAQKRFVPSLPGIEVPGAPLTRFTPRARSAVGAAQKEAHRLGAAEVGPAHLLLGLLAEPEGLAARAVGALGVSASQVRERIGPAATTPPGDAVPAAGQVPYSPAARKVLELTLREALTLGHNYIGTEHLLLAICAEGGTGAQALASLGVTGDAVRQWLLRALADLVAAREKGQS